VEADQQEMTIDDEYNENEKLQFQDEKVHPTSLSVVAETTKAEQTG